MKTALIRLFINYLLSIFDALSSKIIFRLLNYCLWFQSFFFFRSWTVRFVRSAYLMLQFKTWLYNRCFHFRPQSPLFVLSAVRGKNSDSVQVRFESWPECAFFSLVKRKASKLWERYWDCVWKERKPRRPCIYLIMLYLYIRFVHNYFVCKETA